MKKTILVVLMAVMLTTPCLAQEIETDGIFSLEGTRWWYFRPDIFVNISPRPPSIDIQVISGILGFYRGSVYWCDENGCFEWITVNYIDTPVMGISFNLFLVGLELFVMQPTASVGLTTICWCGGDRNYACNFGIGIMLKIDNNWKPEEIFQSISPNRGDQGTTLTDVHIQCVNTFFQDNPPVEINFIPPDGLTVSNINVKNNSIIEVDLEIAVDARIGWRGVIITYDNGNEFLEEDNAFEVLPNSN